MQVNRIYPVMHMQPLVPGRMGVVNLPTVNVLDDETSTICPACAHGFEVGDVVRYVHEPIGYVWVHDRDVVTDARD